MRERAFQKGACELLSLRLRPYGGFVTAIPGGDGQMTRCPGYVSGSPDLVGVVRGVAFFVELKSAKGRVEPHQKDVHALIEKAGARVFLARSYDDIEGVAEALIGGVLRAA